MTNDNLPTDPPLERLRAVMARLRDPETGCPWDVQQSFATIAPYTLEEAYEVVEAIQQNDLPALQDELGDLLLQVVFHARMAEEAGHFDLDDVATSISTKLIRRHPHVFATGEAATPEAVTVTWDAIKAEERAAKAQGKVPGQLEGVPLALPALSRAVKLQKRAAEVGFDWPNLSFVLAKLQEELGEFSAELETGADKARLEEELGDILFVLANVARHLKLDPEGALRGCNAKFERRFASIEAALAKQGRLAKDSTLEEMDALWDAAKRAEKQQKDPA